MISSLLFLLILWMLHYVFFVTLLEALRQTSTHSITIIKSRKNKSASFMDKMDKMFLR